MIKNIFLLSLFVLLSLISKADCMYGVLEVFPNTTTLKKNSLIFLTTYHDTEESVIFQLNKKYNVYLQNGTKKIKLEILQIYSGSAGARQAIMRPERLLQAGHTYTLQIDSLSKYLMPRRYNPLTGKNDSIFFKILDEEDLQKPHVSATPKIIDRGFQQLGCGPMSLVTFDCPVTDDSPFLIKATVRGVGNGVKTIFYISLQFRGKEREKTFNIGRYMCGGAFSFDECENYEVVFSFMDVCGNITDWESQKIEFTDPKLAQENKL